MSRVDYSTSVDEFESLYSASSDPWGMGWKRSLRTLHRARLYDIRKRWRTGRLIPRRPFRCGLQLTCSVGLLTRPLSRRVGHLVALDYSSTALDHARRNNRGRKNITFLEAALPHQFPDARFDLIVFAETAYYLSPADFEATAQRILDQLDPGGVLAMVHYRHHHTLPTGGDAAHDWFVARPDQLLHLKDWRTEHYRMDLFERRPPIAE